MRHSAKGFVIRHGGFNPRICKRCDEDQKQKELKEIVSIHASVKDATSGNSGYGLYAEFQSTHL